MASILPVQRPSNFNINDSLSIPPTHSIGFGNELRRTDITMAWKEAIHRGFIQRSALPAGHTVVKLESPSYAKLSITD